MSIEIERLSHIIEAALLAYGQPLSIDKLLSLFTEEEQVSRQDVREALQSLQQSCEGRGVELVEVGSGFRYQARKEHAAWVSRLWEEKPPRYSRALLETLVLVAYRQPITRAEIEDIRGVSVSTHIMKTLQDRDWVRVVGHKDVPGKPALYATTKAFLDYFSLKSLDELPSLMEIRDLDKIGAEVDLQGQPVPAGVAEQALLDVEDVERLMPDGEADHGDGIEDELEPVFNAESESPITEEVLASEETEIGEGVALAEMESVEAEAEVTTASLEEEAQVETVFSDTDIDAVDESEQAFDTVTDLDEQPLLAAVDEQAEHSDSMEQESIQDQVDELPEDEPRFSTANYGLRAVKQDHEPDEQEFDDEEQPADRLSAAESNS